MNPSLTVWRRVVPLFATVALMGMLLAPSASAQYVETLGPTTATLAPGTGIVTAGVGLFDDGEGTIDITIPAGATVEQVLLFWSGRDNLEQDDEVVVDGTPVTGTLVGTAAAERVEFQWLTVATLEQGLLQLLDFLFRQRAHRENQTHIGMRQERVEVTITSDHDGP